MPPCGTVTIPVIPAAGTAVAVIVPVPVATSDPPDPITSATVLAPVDMPENGTEVAAMVPVPLVNRFAPVPTVIAAVVFVPDVSAVNESAGTPVIALYGIVVEKVKGLTPFP